MSDFHVPMRRTADNTLIVGNTIADATRARRLELWDLMFGCDASPADNMFRARVRRCTTAGTSTATTPRRIDDAEFQTEFDAGENHTVNPTITANSEMIDEPTHQRNSFRWTAVPGREILTPATGANGLVYETPVGPASSVVYNAYIREH